MVAKKRTVHFAIVLAIIIVFLITGIYLINTRKVNIYISNNLISKNAYIINGKTYVPLEDITKALNLYKKWDAENKIVEIEPSTSEEEIAKKIAEKANELIENGEAKNPYENPMAIVNYGLVGEDDEKYYYVLYKEPQLKNMLGDNRIVAEDKKTGKIEEITKVDASSIYIDKEYVYYVTRGEYGGMVIDNTEYDGVVGIYSYNKITKEKKIIAKENAYGLWGKSDYLYYVSLDNRKNLCRIKKDGTNKEVIIPVSIKNFFIYKNYIYYAKENEKGIYRYNIKDGDTIKFAENVEASSIIVNEGKLYFVDVSDSGRLKMSGLRGENITVVTEDTGLSNISIVNEGKSKALYYVHIAVDFNAKKPKVYDEIVRCEIKDGKAIKRKVIMKNDDYTALCVSSEYLIVGEIHSKNIDGKPIKYNEIRKYNK
ncbi:MAG: DUF5050 domain-containing protein [Thermovenabulum sp.]|uniref:DUF5050 domain-containing protein n=1 Tax=Thermovenabulum sp. TaxID=3100335 RepID=UPI003C79A464